MGNLFKKYKQIFALFTVICLFISENFTVLAATNNTNIKANNIILNENEMQSIALSSNEKAVSYNKNVVDIETNGCMTGIHAGKTKILVRSDTDQKYINVKIIKPSINVKEENITLYYGKDNKYSTKYVLNPSIKGSNKDYIILDYDKNIIDIKDNKEINPLKAGKTSITISANGISKKCNINVYRNTISINKNNVILSANINSPELSNDNIQITSLVGAKTKVKWSTSDKNVCAVKNGAITAISPGEADITVSANGESSICKVKIKPEEELYACIKEDIYKGLKYKITSNKDNNKYSTSNPNIATVDSDNMLCAKNEGKCTIFVKNNDENYSFDIEIKPIITEIKATACYFKTKKDNLKYQLDFNISGPDKAYKFISSDNNICDVNNNGILTIKNSGSCNITLFANDKESKAKIVVEKSNSDFELNYSKYRLYTGFGNKVRLKTYPKQNNIVYTSFNPEIATVNDKGLITALNPGYAVITANNNGIQRECIITVEKSDILFDRNITFVKPNEKRCIPFDIVGYKQNAKYNVNNKKIATVKKGIVIGKKIGETTVTIKVNGIEKTHKIVVGDCLHAFTESTIKENTCINNGLARYACKICGYCYEDDININTNKHINEYESNIIRPASCEYDGIEIISCKGCNGFIKQNSINRIEHKYIWIDESELSIKKCSICNKVINIKPIGMPEKPSILDPDVPIANNPEVPFIYDDNEVIQHNHIFGEWITDVIPTCMNNGHKYRLCDCGYYDEETVNASGHIYESSFKCKFCSRYKPGFYDNNSNLIINFEDGNINVSKDYDICNYINICAEDNECKSENGKCICYKYENGKLKLLNIPDKHILFLMKSHPEIKKIVIPEDINIIGKNALAFIDGIDTIILPDSIKSFNNGAFRDCRDLTNINIPESLEKIDDDAFREDKNLKEIIYKNISILSTQELFDLLKKLNINIGKSVFSGTSEFNNHHYDNYITDINPKCESNGLRHRVCKDLNCGYREDDIILPLGHQYNDYTIDISANCVSNGYKSKKCNRCSSITELTIIEPLGHIESDYIITKYPDCENEGTKIKKCIICNETLEIKSINKLNHDFIEDGYVSSTCTGFGNIHYKCSRFGCIKTKDVAISPTGHIKKPSVSENIVPPKCLNNGREDIVIYCEVCNVELSRTTKILPALGHKYSYSFTVDVKPACTEKGSKSRHCIRENDDYCSCTSITDIMEVEPLGHDYSKESNRVKVHATCTDDGLNYYDCLRCNNADNDYFTYIVPAIGHNFKDEYTIDLSPTCTRSGIKSRHCTQCYESTDITNLPVLPHDYSAESNRVCVLPTCLSNGSNYYDCSACGNTDNIDKTKTYSTPALGHNHSDSFTTDLSPTCTMTGIKSKHCTRAGCESKIELTPISVIAHTEANGGTINVHKKCGSCGVTLNTQHSYTNKVKIAATCTGKGTHTYSCNCGYSYDSQDISATGHTEANGGTAAVHKKCSKCGITLNTNHSYTSKVKIAATCTGKGTHTYSCSCGYSYDSQDIPATGHIETNGGNVNVHKKCGTCGLTLVSASGHSYTSKIKVESTCTTKGINTYTCSCGYTYDFQNRPLAAHVPKVYLPNNTHFICANCKNTIPVK